MMTMVCGHVETRMLSDTRRGSPCRRSVGRAIKQTRPEEYWPVRIDPNALVYGDNLDVLDRYIPDEGIEVPVQLQREVTLDRAPRERGGRAGVARRFD